MTNIDFNFGMPAEYTTSRYSGWVSGGSMDVVSSGSPINLITIGNKDFTFTGTSVTPNRAGVYLIMYRVDVTSTQTIGVSIFQNGKSLPQLTSSGVPANHFVGCSMAGLNAGDTVQMMFYGYTGTVTLAGGAGATLNIIRIA